jgi:hypothetical protein
LAYKPGANRPSHANAVATGAVIKVGARKGGLPGSGGLGLLRHQLEPVGHSAELVKRMEVRLLHRLRGTFTVALGNAVIASNLAKATPSDVKHDFALPGAQRADTLAELGKIIPAPNRSRNRVQNR